MTQLNWERIFDKTRVGFGRTEVSARLEGIVFVCALSFGQGPRRMGFEGGWEGVDFNVFWGAVLGRVKSYKIGQVFLKKLESGLVVQRFPLGWII